MSSRPPKWDWAFHLPRMIELYNTQMSIPDIYKAVQCEGFEPCQRSVYAKFKQMGYPTDPVGRNKLLEARSTPTPTPAPSNTNSNTDGTTPTPATYLQSPTLHAATHSQTHLYTLPEDEGFEDTNECFTADVGAQAQPEHITGNASDYNTFMEFETAQTNVLSNAPSDFGNWMRPSSGQVNNVSTTSFESTFDFESAALDIEGAEYFGIDMGVHVTPPQPFEETVGDSQFTGWNVASPFAPQIDQYDPSMMDVDLEMPTYQDQLPRLGTQGTASVRAGSTDVKTPFQGFLNHSNSANSASTRSRLRSLFRRNSGTSVKSNSSLKKYATSQFTSNTKDSGYSSGFGSCLSLDESRRVKAQSLKEFNGLYRVACEHLHEPRGKAQCKDIPSCAYCLYSSIHNLGWSARYLKFEVFLTELMLIGVYDINAKDAAGNTALHYAAAGGASFRHLSALISAGADPYAANTAGELFIYCLRPIEPFTLEPNMDCLNSEDLIQLLRLVQLNRVQNWRDNDGQTVLHALYSKIAEPQLRTQVLSMFVEAGYLPTVRDRFGRTASDVVPLKYDCHGQVIESECSLSRRTSNDSSESRYKVTPEDLITAEWRAEQLNQIKAQSTLVEGHRNPQYFDRKSHENVFHALSRLKNGNEVLKLGRMKASTGNVRTVEGSNIINNIRHFVEHAADLDAYDRYGCSPLKAFVFNRPLHENETGATLSKYLDAMLWKDSRKTTRTSANVNLKDCDGMTALHCAVIRARPDSVRSLIEAGANANARTDDGTSVLQAAHNALHGATKSGDIVLVYMMREVVSYLEHAGAVADPSSLEERGRRSA